jgi:hypothetical protein
MAPIYPVEATLLEGEAVLNSDKSHPSSLHKLRNRVILAGSTQRYAQMNKRSVKDS